jgi:hypothetical protein
MKRRRRPKGRPTKRRSAKRRPARGSKARSQILLGRTMGSFTLLTDAPTAHVTVTRKQDGDARVSAKLNNFDLSFTNDVAHAVVGRGQTNSLEWRVVGSERSGWAIRVLEPADTDCGDGGVLDHTGEEAGQCRFAT